MLLLMLLMIYQLLLSFSEDDRQTGYQLSSTNAYGKLYQTYTERTTYQQRITQKENQKHVLDQIRSRKLNCFETLKAHQTNIKWTPQNHRKNGQ